MKVQTTFFVDPENFEDPESEVRWLKEVELMVYMIYELSIWIQGLVPDEFFDFHNFFGLLRDGVIFCKLMKSLSNFRGKDYFETVHKIKIKSHEMCLRDRSGFHSRDNIVYFLDWCRQNGYFYF